MRRLLKLLTSQKMDSDSKLIVGLGNIGAEYSKTRHNAGFLALDWLAAQLDASSWSRSSKLKADIAKSLNHELILAKPNTMMNLSGQSVVKIMHYYKIKQANLYVFHDDADLSMGKIRFADNTVSGAGHHGVLSIIQHIGKGFKRIRIGIGRPNQQDRDISNYVLGRLSKKDLAMLDKSFINLIDLIQKK